MMWISIYSTQNTMAFRKTGNVSISSEKGVTLWMTKTESYLNMYDLYKKGFSLSEVAKEFGVTRQTVYAGFKRRGLKMRTKKPREHVITDGRKFTLGIIGYFEEKLKNRQ